MGFIKRCIKLDNFNDEDGISIDNISVTGDDTTKPVFSSVNHLEMEQSNQLKIHPNLAKY